jgi:imidazolonepropionase-like amidohydrolase
MQRTLFTNVMVWTADRPAFPAEVLVDGGRIAAVGAPADRVPRDGATVIDGGGATLMPGLIDGHAHLPFAETKTTVEFALIPAEEHTLITMHNARRVLDAGFTSVLSGGSVKPRLDAIIRDQVNAGLIPGPRILASTPEFTCTGGLGDDSRMHITLSTFCLTLDGADEFRKAARLYIREGSDVVKVCVSGHMAVPGCRHAAADMTPVTEAELAAVTETTRALGKMCAVHARSDAAVRMSLKHGVDIFYHCEYATDETLDLMEEAKDQIVLAPAFGPYCRTLENAEAEGRRHEYAALDRQMVQMCETFTKIRKRGLRVMIGGEYGLYHIPHGTNARDMDYFVRYFGYSHAEALKCATLWGAHGMRLEHELGQVKEGFVADLLLVDGAPWQDVRVLESKERLLAIMQAGRFYKTPPVDQGRVRRAA